jgi:hypothetical protein
MLVECLYGVLVWSGPVLSEGDNMSLLYFCPS